MHEFQLLPNEILDYILTYLDPSSNLKARLISKNFRERAESVLNSKAYKIAYENQFKVLRIIYDINKLIATEKWDKEITLKVQSYSNKARSVFSVLSALTILVTIFNYISHQLDKNQAANDYFHNNKSLFTPAPKLISEQNYPLLLQLAATGFLMFLYWYVPLTFRSIGINYLFFKKEEIPKLGFIKPLINEPIENKPIEKLKYD